MYLYIGMILLLCVLLFVLSMLFRKAKTEKICKMSCPQKLQIIENLVFPFGYTYIPKGDFFSSALEAWQRRFGYAALYDKSASHFHMVFNALPVYFDYDGRTWLIEFWKGQYGLHTGCEIGVYCSDRILRPAERSAELYHAVSDEELLPMSFVLKQNDTTVAALSGIHWWLTAFCPGVFSDPEDLTMETSITFPNLCMAYAFRDALEKEGYDVCICGLKICFTFSDCKNCSFSCLQKCYRRWIQWQNRLLCRLFLWYTRPFDTALDRILFLCESLPFAFHKTLQLHKSNRKIRRQL